MIRAWRAWSGAPRRRSTSWPAGLDLLRDLAIERIDFAAGEVVGRVRGGEPIPMRLELREGLIVVHTL